MQAAVPLAATPLAELVDADADDAAAAAFDAENGDNGGVG